MYSCTKFNKRFSLESFIIVLFIDNFHKLEYDQNWSKVIEQIFSFLNFIYIAAQLLKHVFFLFLRSCKCRFKCFSIGNNGCTKLFKHKIEFRFRRMKVTC